MLTLLSLVVVLGVGAVLADEADDQAQEIAKLKQDIKDLEKRVMATERKSALDRINFIGDFRFEANSIQANFDPYFDGMQLQRALVDTLFYYGAIGMPPMSPQDVPNFIRDNYGDYLYYVDFSGRLATYKVWGDSTGVQVFNGQPTSINVDGTTTSVPNSGVLRVERAYLTWKSPKLYLSIGRRPSTGGAPLNFRNDEPRGGTPLSSIINYQFDDATFGWHISDKSTFRLCYGVGFESGFGTGDLIQRPQDRIKDAWFLGIKWDIWNTDDLIAPKTSVRGDVFELFLTHRITKRFILKADYMRYNFDYSQSGWHMGAPKKLESTPAPILGFASPTSMDKFLLGLTARF